MPRKLPLLIGPKPLPVGQRPNCMWCGKELRPNIRMIDARIEYQREGELRVNTIWMGRYFTGQYGHGSAFCSGSCAERWAIYHVRKRTGEYPKLKEPEVQESWKQFARKYLERGGYGMEFRLPDVLLKGKKWTS